MSSGEDPPAERRWIPLSGSLADHQQPILARCSLPLDGVAVPNNVVTHDVGGARGTAPLEHRPIFAGPLRAEHSVVQADFGWPAHDERYVVGRPGHLDL